jgi:hypothetical protein
MLRRRPLMRAAATTAVVAGTAGAVRHHQDQKYAAQQAQQAPAPAPEAAPEAAPAEDPIEMLKKLAELHDQGILTDEEFAQQKAKLLG